MINGTINGEINVAMMILRNGINGFDKPIAATVPKPVDKAVAATAIIAELIAPVFHLSEHMVLIDGSLHIPSMFLYHFRENPSGSSDSISGVNDRKTPLVNDNGITTINGAIKKNNTKAQIVRYV